MAKKMKLISKIVYSLVGLSAVASAIWAFTFEDFLNMPLWSIIAIILLIIGGLNWGIVAITGDRTKDLFGLLKM